MDGETVVSTYTIVVKGDVNGDGKITGVDYALVKRHVLGIYEFQGAYFQAASIVRSGLVMAHDYAMIKRHVLGHIQL
jgi:hypothetical protein